MRLGDGKTPRVLWRTRVNLQQYSPRNSAFQLFLLSFKTQFWEEVSNWVNKDYGLVLWLP